MSKFLQLVFISLLSMATSNAQIFHRDASRKVEQGLFGKSPGKKRGMKVKEPRKVIKAKKKQESNEKKLKKDYVRFVKRSQKRTIQIQTPEVQARMKQNKKDSAVRDRVKQKKIKASTKGAGKKYKRLYNSQDKYL